MYKYPKINAYRLILIILLIFNILGGLYLAVAVGFEKGLDCSVSADNTLDCKSVTHFSLKQMILVLIAPTLSGFILIVLITVLDYIKYLEETLYTVRAQVRHMQKEQEKQL